MLKAYRVSETGNNHEYCIIAANDTEEATEEYKIYFEEVRFIQISEVSEKEMDEINIYDEEKRMNFSIRELLNQLQGGHAQIIAIPEI